MRKKCFEKELVIQNMDKELLILRAEVERLTVVRNETVVDQATHSNDMQPAECSHSEIQKVVNDLRAKCAKKELAISNMDKNLSNQRLEAESALAKLKNDISYLNKLVFKMQKDVAINLCSLLPVPLGGVVEEIGETCITLKLPSG